MKHLAVISILGGILWSLSACDNNSIETISPKRVPELGIPGVPRYLKPGAKITFTHDFDGQLIPQQSQAVELSFLSKHPDGELSIRLQADPGLIVSPSIDEYSLVLDSNDPLVINVSLTAEQPGKYYLTLFATLTSTKGMPAHRVFALAVNARQRGPQADNIITAKTNASKLERLILLPVTEVMSNGDGRLL